MTLWRRAAFGAVASAVLAVGLMAATPTAASAAESNGGVKIMPLGDSITDGYNVAGGYRNWLWQHFYNDSYHVDFVGSGSNGPSTLGDRDHEGHTGYFIHQLDSGINAWLADANPRTVLLHVGTNDMAWDIAPSEAPARLGGLIDKILAGAPSADVFVATIIPSADADDEARLLFTSLQQAFVNLRRGRPGLLPPPFPAYEATLAPADRFTLQQVLSASVVGGPDTVRRGLADFVARTGADELMVASQLFDHGARLRSYEIAAEVSGLVSHASSGSVPAHA